MADAHNYLVPEYFSGFSCKGGSCRNTCCHGWGISLSMGEYFRLLGLTCPPDLKRKLDCAFHLVENPTPERYAQITHNWLGDCPMYMENGLCRLHAECGGDVLPQVCRYYPRGVHTGFARECSCSNSCEQVLEILFGWKDVMRFEERALSFDLPEQAFDAEDCRARFYQPVRKLIIDALQNRKYEFSRRMALVGGMLRLLNEAFRNGESWVISGAIEVCGVMNPPELPERNDPFALIAVYRLMRMFSKNVSVEAYIERIMERLGFSPDSEPDERQLAEAAGIFRADAQRFDEEFSEWPRFFEQMLVNHVFFECFPFSDRHETLWEEFLSLCAVGAFVRLMAVMGTEQGGGREALIDVCAAAFRLIGHSAFDRNAAALLTARGYNSFDDMMKLVQI